MSTAFAPVYAPPLLHQLLWSLRFTDVFTGLVIDAPLTVTVPALRLVAVHDARDRSYRLVFDPRATPPAGPDVAVLVSAGRGDYIDQAGITVPPVRPAPGHVPVLVGDVLKTFPLWPTRALAPSPGETVVVGRVVGAGGAPLADHRVAIAINAPALATAPVVRSDAAGEFLYRLPGLRRAPGVLAMDLALAVTAPGGANVPVSSPSHPPAVPPAANRCGLPLGSVSTVILQA